MIVYAFEYCECKYESGFETVSLHFEKADAWREMRRRKVADFLEWHEDRIRHLRGWPGDKFPDWTLYRIRERTIT